MQLHEFFYTVLCRPRLLKRLVNGLILRLLPARLKIGAALVHLDPQDPVVSGALALGVYEKPELHFFQACCRPGMVVLDVGANVGLYTALALRLAGPQGVVVSVEPHPHSGVFLRRTIADNLGQAASARSFMLPVAVSAKSGRMKLFLNQDNHGDNRLYDSELASGSIEVDVETLDEALAGIGISVVDFIKIDVQGWEPHVIAGAVRLLGSSPDVILMSEFWPQGIEAAGRKAEEYLQDLQRAGFDLFELQKKRLIAMNTPEKFDDLISRYSGRRYACLVGLKGRYRRWRENGPAGLQVV